MKTWPTLGMAMMLIMQHPASCSTWFAKRNMHGAAQLLQGGAMSTTPPDLTFRNTLMAVRSPVGVMKLNSGPWRT